MNRRSKNQYHQNTVYEWGADPNLGLSVLLSGHVRVRVCACVRECVYVNDRWGGSVLRVSCRERCAPRLCLSCPLDVLSGAEAVPRRAGRGCPSGCQKQGSASSLRKPPRPPPPF